MWLTAFAVALDTGPLLLEAQRRHSSNARAAFAASVSSPLLKDPLHNPLELAALIAAEEQHTVQLPSRFSTRIESGIEQIVAPAAQRIALSKRMGCDIGAETIATAVSSTLFGTGGGSLDDEDAEGGYFRGAGVDYYDPQNSYLDCVLERRQGIPISLSLITASACAQLGLPMVGLNSPGHLLLAPADGSPFVLNCYHASDQHSAIMTEDEAAIFIGQRLQPRAAARAGTDPEQQLDLGRTALRSLRASPMTALSWGARILRNLRGIHTASGDAMRLIGVCDRLRSIGAHSRIAVGDDEMRECAAQVALCIYALKWTQRRTEARRLLLGLLSSCDDETERLRIEDLLAQPWFDGSDEGPGMTKARG